MSARTAVAAGLAGYLVGRFVGQARAWLDVLADLPDLPTDDDPALDEAFDQARALLVPAPRTPLDLERTCYPSDLEHVRAARVYPF